MNVKTKGISAFSLCKSIAGWKTFVIFTDKYHQVHKMCTAQA